MPFQGQGIVNGSELDNHIILHAYKHSAIWASLI